MPCSALTLFACEAGLLVYELILSRIRMVQFRCIRMSAFWAVFEYMISFMSPCSYWRQCSQRRHLMGGVDGDAATCRPASLLERSGYRVSPQQGNVQYTIKT